MTLGPKKIQALLQQQFPHEHISSRPELLNVEGLALKRQRTSRVAPFEPPFAPVSEPNDLWPADFKEHLKWPTATGAAF
jgi:hypothetical protein